jgi:hypothetical protein
MREYQDAAPSRSVPDEEWDSLTTQIRKLRWRGMEDEARQLIAALEHLKPAANARRSVAA